MSKRDTNSYEFYDDNGNRTEPYAKGSHLRIFDKYGNEYIDDHVSIPTIWEMNEIEEKKLEEEKEKEKQKQIEEEIKFEKEKKFKKTKKSKRYDENEEDY